MKPRMYPDVSVLLTLDFEQEPLLRKCTIYKESIQRLNIQCYLLSTVKRIRNSIAQGIVEAGGNALRGLWHHLCMYKGGGVPHILENALITEADLPSIQSFFRKKIEAQKRPLAKSQIQMVEVWANEIFREMEAESGGNIPVMSFLKRLSVLLNEYYVEAKNALLRTESELKLVDEEQVDPEVADISTLENALNQVGFDDKEDLEHIACLVWLKQNKGYIPIFATADRELYECKDIIYNITGVIVDDALYAAGTYSSIK